MIAKTLVAALVLCVGLMLASCSSFSDFVADNWPHIAGGEPNGLPPRPGEPGYARFIAHGQPVAQTNPSRADGQPTSAIGNAPAPQSVTGRPPVAAGQDIGQGGGPY